MISGVLADLPNARMMDWGGGMPGLWTGEVVFYLCRADSVTNYFKRLISFGGYLKNTDVTLNNIITTTTTIISCDKLESVISENKNY